MTLESRITELASAIGVDIKTLNTALMDPTKGKLNHQLFTSNGTWVVPAGVNVVWIDMVGGGDGGGGGYESDTSGGGGAGGTGLVPFVGYRFPVVPNEVLTITVGGGGVGGAVGQRGGVGGISKVRGSLHYVVTLTSATSGPGPSPGLVAAGGQAGSLQPLYLPVYIGDISPAIRGGGAGGAPSVNGGASTIGNINGNSAVFLQGGIAVGTLGGGGSGGCNVFGIGGVGGNGGQQGGDAPTTYNFLPSWGGSGGGGGCNGGGGNGAPGMVRIYWQG